MRDRLGVAFSEAATWRGIIMLLTAVGLEIEPEQQTAIIQAGLAIVGLISVFFRRDPSSIKP